MSWLSESARWYGVLLLIAWGLAPLARWLGSCLPDRGATIARPLALLALVWPAWFLASVSPLPFSTAGLWATLALGTAAGWGVAVRRGWVTREWLRALLVTEAVTLVAFAGYVGLRGYTPGIFWTEKPMDVAFLAASARATSLPPADPWYAGETINYYYLGYFLHGSLARLAGVPTWVAFNLALATTVATTVTAAAGLAFNIARARLGRGGAVAAAALAALFLVFAGNLHAPKELLKQGRTALDASWWGPIGWASSRIVVDHGSPQEQTINEFPWFSFLLGDLHPHVTALPYTVVALTLALTLLRAGRAWDGGDRHRDWPALAVTGVAIGALYPLNSWDLPTYLALALGALLLGAGWSRPTLERLALLVVAAVAAWLPFTLTFVPFAGGDPNDLPAVLRDVPLVSRLLTTVGVYDGERTAIGEFLTVFGIPWALAVVFLATEIARAMRAGKMPRLSGRTIAVALVVALAAIVLPAPVLILAGAPLAAAGWLLQRQRAEGGTAEARTVVTGLFAAAFALILLTEFFYIQDAFSGRYNTLFKVYYQAWSLLAVGGALAAALLWRATAGQAAWRVLLSAGLAVALIAGLAYPVVASIQWTRVTGARAWQGLDGLAFMGQHSPDDEAAIRWLADHAEPDDVVLEAPGCSYQVNGGVPTGRLAAFTGVPTVIGWGFHQVQWRGGQPELLARITPRAEDVAAMYENPQSPLFDEYGVTLLYVGSFERAGAGPDCRIAGPFDAVTRPGYPGPGWIEVWRAESGEARLFRRVSE